MVRMLRIVLFAVVLAAVGWWLFADTVRHHGIGREKRALRISYWGDYVPYLMWQEMFETFEAEHPDILIEQLYITDRYESKIQQLMVAGSAPDVIVFQDETFPNFVDAGQFADLTSFLDTPGYGIDLDDFYDTAVKTFGRYEGTRENRRWHTYGIPQEGGCNMLYYNRDCFRRSGIRLGELPGPEGLVNDPDGDGWILDGNRWTLDEFVRICHMLTRDFDGDGRIDQWGFSLPEGADWLPFHWTMGARVLDPSLRNLAFMGPECEASLALMQDLRYRHKVSPAPADLGSMAGVAFYTGSVAMATTGPWGMHGISKANVDFGILHFPRGSPGGYRATRVSWSTYAIHSESRMKEDAWKLIHHLLGPACQEIMARYQRNWPARRSTVPVFLQFSPTPDAEKFGAAIEEYGRLQPITMHWALMSRDLDLAIEGLLHPDPKSRLTPGEAIGLYLSADRVTEVFPPVDPVAAERYREIYRQRGKVRRTVAEARVEASR